MGCIKLAVDVTPAPTPKVTPTPKPTPTATPTTTVPRFEAVFAVASLLVTAYAALRRRK